MSGVEIVKVKNEDEGIRLNRWFLKYYPGLSLGRLQKLLRTKQIKVDGQRAEANTRLMGGTEIRVPPLDNEKKVPEHAEISEYDAKFIEDMVIYKDDNLIVLNKPSGLAVQGGTNTQRHIDGMLDALKSGRDERPKLVHRIDKDTSGVLVLARNRKTADLLTKAFREHTLKKRIWLSSAAFLRKNMERLRRRWKSGRQGAGFGRGKAGSDRISGFGLCRR